VVSNAAAHLAARRRQIKLNGAVLTLRRQTATNPATYRDVSLLGMPAFYKPGTLTGGVQQGDAQVQILTDEITAAGWPGPPRVRDLLIVDGRTWSVIGANPVMVGPLTIGFSLWIRGGAG
jgi:hypothetical protein